jgi:hypothetical protein
VGVWFLKISKNMELEVISYNNSKNHPTPVYTYIHIYACAWYQQFLKDVKVPVGNNGTRLVLHSKVDKQKKTTEVDKYQSNIGHDHTSKDTKG